MSAICDGTLRVYEKLEYCTKYVVQIWYSKHQFSNNGVHTPGACPDLRMHAHEMLLRFHPHPEI